MTNETPAPKLTMKQQRFVEAYAGPAKGNATEAARLAGYKGNDGTLGSVGGENLKKPAIQAALARLHDEVRTSAIATVEEVKEILTAIARDVTAKDIDRIAAGDKLLKCAGEYIERRQHEHTGVQRVVFKVPDNGRGPEAD